MLIFFVTSTYQVIFGNERTRTRTVSVRYHFRDYLNDSVSRVTRFVIEQLDSTGIDMADMEEQELMQTHLIFAD